MRQHKNRCWGRKVRLGLTYLILTLVSAALLLPVFWMVSTSFKDPSSIVTETPVWIPPAPTGDNYRTLWSTTDFPRYLANSLILAVGTTVLAVSVGVLAGYAVSRYRFAGARLLSMSLLLFQMFPSVVLIIPIFMTVAAFGMLNTYTSLILTYSSFAVPFATWLVKGYFDSLPRELDEAGLIDGCGPLQVLTRVLLPLTAPGLVAVSLFTFILAWQEYVFALTLTNVDGMRPLSIGLSLLVGEHRVMWGPLMAGSTLATMPVIAFFLYLQRYLVQGMTLGAVKG